LLIDDDAASVRLVQAVLASEGWALQVVTTAEAALVAIPEFGPDVLLVDLRLPGMNGLELVRQLKADPKTASIVIVVVTVVTSVPTEKLALAAGCAAYIRKPIDVFSFATQIVAAYTVKHD
jgi:CheY-like chemotaxis protein